MGDGGCGTGAALAEFAGTEPTRNRIKDVYYGPEYSGDEIVEALKRAGLPFTRYTPIEPKVAMLLAAGKVVARFTGRMEYGPRALGHRSILYHAKEPAVNQWLNQRLGRTEFMPFAPSTLYEHRQANYKLVDGADYAAQFMTITFDCTESMKRDCPGGRPRRRHCPAPARVRRREPELSPASYGVLQAHGNSIRDQHQFQHARGTDRLLTG
jgi:carbamoyltransferase